MINKTQKKKKVDVTEESMKGRKRIMRLWMKEIRH